MTDAPGRVNSIVTRAILSHSGDMRVSFQIIVAGLVVGACAPLSLYYRPGVEVSRMQSDATRCEVAALKDAPIANEVRQHPPVYMPGTRYCGGGGCYHGPGYWVGGGVYTVDVNRDLRRRVQNMCMAEKGYEPVRLPRCPASVARQVPAAATRTLPPLSQSSCAISNRDGSWQIVTPETMTSAE